ncbi:MAG: DUF3096 domain-containing protein [Candidatus Pacearchaeota archaeon]
MIFALQIPILVVAIITILFGVAIIVFPKLLHWIIGLYLILIGILSLVGIFA